MRQQTSLETEPTSSASWSPLPAYVYVLINGHHRRIDSWPLNFTYWSLANNNRAAYYPTNAGNNRWMPWINRWMPLSTRLMLLTNRWMRWEIGKCGKYGELTRAKWPHTIQEKWRILCTNIHFGNSRNIETPKIRQSQPSTNESTQIHRNKNRWDQSHVVDFVESFRTVVLTPLEI